VSNIHEYVFFDRAVVDPMLNMRWPALEARKPSWCQWESAEQFLAEWALAPEHAPRAREIIARETIHQTILLSDTPSLTFDTILDEKGFAAAGVTIGRGDYTYNEEIVSCARAGYLRGELSLASLASAFQLHASETKAESVFPPDLWAKILVNRPVPRTMLPALPDLLQNGSDGVGVADARRFMAFILRAVDEDWPVDAPGRKPPSGRAIRSCEVATDLAEVVRSTKLAKPCIYRWYEC
jgi:hypothetical protein